MLAAQRLQSLACRPDACIVAHAVKRVRDVKAHGTLPPSDRSRSAGTSTSSSTATAAAAAVHDGAVSMAPRPASSQTEVPKSHAEQLAQEHQASQAFVNLFRQASPYIEGHRGRTFVITLPGQVGAGSRQAGSGRQLPHLHPPCRLATGTLQGMQLLPAAQCQLAYHLENRRTSSSAACGVQITRPLKQQQPHALVHPLPSYSSIDIHWFIPYPLVQQHQHAQILHPPTHTVITHPPTTTALAPIAALH